MSHPALVSQVDGTNVGSSAAIRPLGPSKGTLWGGLVKILKWVFSFPAMLGTAFLGSLLYQLREFKVDPDLWWHIKLGQDIVRARSWPTSDPYSFTVHGTPWIAYEWLGDVIIGFVARFGLQALEAMLMVMASLILQLPMLAPTGLPYSGIPVHRGIFHLLNR